MTLAAQFKHKMTESWFDGDIEEKLQQLAENPPTLEEAKAILEESGRYESVEIVPSDDKEP